MALALIIALPFLGICLPLLLERFGRSACAFGAGMAPLLALVLLLSKRAAVFGGETQIVTVAWLPELGLNLSLRLDGLGFLFALLILGIGLLVILYVALEMTFKGAFCQYPEALAFLSNLFGPAAEACHISGGAAH